ncbi:MAG: hypothetical protein IT384_08305 [Deltaproteobacteria bacterium]|nr:hypothetical protein [Deltaproteobacteria bacterium]
MGQCILYQVINHTSQELFFGMTELPLDKEIERLAKDPKAPCAHWKKGDIVQWRPLTEQMEERFVRTLHRDVETRTPPNNFRVIKTFGAA